MGINRNKNYHSYLLRMWQVEDLFGQEWRGSLQDVVSGEKLGFACLDDLFDLLQEITQVTDEPLAEGRHYEVQG